MIKKDLKNNDIKDHVENSEKSLGRKDPDNLINVWMFLIKLLYKVLRNPDYFK